MVTQIYLCCCYYDKYEDLLSVGDDHDIENLNKMYVQRAMETNGSWLMSQQGYS